MRRLWIRMAAVLVFAPACTSTSGVGDAGAGGDIGVVDGVGGQDSMGGDGGSPCDPAALANLCCCDFDQVTDPVCTDAGWSCTGSYALWSGAQCTDPKGPCSMPGPGDAGGTDGGQPDAGPADADAGAGGTDGGPTDAGALDTEPGDADMADTGPDDAHMADTGPDDAGPGDAGPTDAATPDAGPDPTDVGPAFDTAGCTYFTDPILTKCNGDPRKIYVTYDFGTEACPQTWTLADLEYDSFDELAAANGCDCAYVAFQSVSFLTCQGPKSGYDVYKSDCGTLYDTPAGPFEDLCEWPAQACYCE